MRWVGVHSPTLPHKEKAPERKLSTRASDINEAKGLHERRLGKIEGGGLLHS